MELHETEGRFERAPVLRELSRPVMSFDNVYGLLNLLGHIKAFFTHLAWAMMNTEAVCSLNESTGRGSLARGPLALPRIKL